MREGGGGAAVHAAQRSTGGLRSASPRLGQGPGARRRGLVSLAPDTAPTSSQSKPCPTPSLSMQLSKISPAPRSSTACQGVCVCGGGVMGIQSRRGLDRGNCRGRPAAASDVNDRAGGVADGHAGGDAVPSGLPVRIPPPEHPPWPAAQRRRRAPRARPSPCTATSSTARRWGLQCKSTQPGSPHARMQGSAVLKQCGSDAAICFGPAQPRMIQPRKTLRGITLWTPWPLPPHPPPQTWLAGLHREVVGVLWRGDVHPLGVDGDDHRLEGGGAQS